MVRACLAVLMVGVGACGPLPELEEDAGRVVLVAVPDAGPVVDAGVAPPGVVVFAEPVLLDARIVWSPSEPALYPVGARHSPVTASVVANLKRIAANGPRLGGVFSKIGDSNTVDPNFMSCFAGSNVDLGGRTALQATIDQFKPGPSFTRVSQAATVGWSAGAAIAGSPSPLENEVNALSPRYALVMFGTNDIGDGTGDVFRFARNMFGMTDQLIAKGVVPLLTTLPPRDDQVAGEARVPEFDAVVRGIAQARQVPLMELGRAMRALTAHGLGGDRLHLNVFTVNGYRRGCVFTSAGLNYGHNTRNLLSLEALARARDAVESSIAAEAMAPVQKGAGTLADPFVVGSLPFVDLRDTSKGASNRISTYSGCASTTDESGPEYLYKLTVTQPTAVKIQVFALNGADIDVHLMTDPASAGCAVRNDRQISYTLLPGTWWLSLDTYVAAGSVKSGEYLLSILPQ